MSKIAIIGSGFVGQATGMSLAEKGNEVLFIDILPEKVEKLLSQGYRAGGPEALFGEELDVAFISVPTPSLDSGKVDMKYIESASRALGAGMLSRSRNFPVVVVKSTVPPGTTEELVTAILEKESGKLAGEGFGVAMVPEYLREAVALEDARKPRAVAIGTSHDRAYEILEDLFKPFECQIVRLKPIEAEMQKYVHNCFNAAKISFFNEMRELADAVGADSEKIFQLAAITAEGSWNPLYGTKDRGHFDGSCLPKDTAGLLDWSKVRLNRGLTVLQAVVDFNRDLQERRRR